jgi:hypothetical protein
LNRLRIVWCPFSSLAPSPPKFTIHSIRYPKRIQRAVVAEEPVDEETGKAIVHSKKSKDKPISHEDVLALQYRPYIQEGQILSSRCKFHRAIDVFTKAMDMNKKSCIVLMSVRINASTERAESTVFFWSADGWGESGIAIGAETWIESDESAGVGKSSNASTKGTKWR